VCEDYGKKCCGKKRKCGMSAAPNRANETLRVLGHNHKTGSWLIGAMLFCATQQLPDNAACYRAGTLCRVSTWDGSAADKGLRTDGGAQIATPRSRPRRIVSIVRDPLAMVRARVRVCSRAPVSSSLAPAPPPPPRRLFPPGEYLGTRVSRA
jgi:hypothetical protein